MSISGVGPGFVNTGEVEEGSVPAGAGAAGGPGEELAAPAADRLSQTGGPRGLGGDLLAQSLSAWRIDASAPSRVSADALPLEGLVPGERALHADMERTLAQARPELALATLTSRQALEAKVAELRPQVEGLQKRAGDLAAKYEAEAAACPDPARREGLELRADYYAGLSRSIGARFSEMVEQNTRTADLKYGAPKTVAPLTLEKLATPKGHGEIEQGWNKLATDALNEARKLDLQKTGKDELAKVIAKAFPGADQVPEADRAKYNEAIRLLSKEIAGKVVGSGPGVAATNLLTGLIGDATELVHAQITFSRAEAEVKQEIAEKGGLYPGEEKTAEAALAPLAAKVNESADKLETKLDAGGSVDVKWNPDVLFVSKVKGNAAVTWEKSDFRAKVYVNAEIANPLTPNATLSVNGGAELSEGNFSAKVYGSATVERLWTDPVLGPTATVGLDLRYKDEPSKLAVGLYGKAILPAGPGGAGTGPRVEGGLEVSKGNVAFNVGANATSNPHGRTDYNVTAGLKIRF